MHIVFVTHQLEFFVIKLYPSWLFQSIAAAIGEQFSMYACLSHSCLTRHINVPFLEPLLMYYSQVMFDDERRKCYINIQWDSSHENVMFYILYKSYKKHSRSNHHNPRTANAVDIPPSPPHTTPPLYRKTYLGPLNHLPAITAWPDTPRGPKPPHP